MDGKLIRGNIRVKEDFGLINLTGFLLKTGQGNQASPGGWGRMSNLIRY